MEDKNWVGYGTAAVGGMAGIGSTLVFSIYFSGTAWCEPNEQCVREWLSATSGWAAFCAALIALLFSIRERNRDERWRREDSTVAHQGFHTALRRGGAVAAQLRTIADILTNIVVSTKRASLEDKADFVRASDAIRACVQNVDLIKDLLDDNNLRKITDFDSRAAELASFLRIQVNAFRTDEPLGRQFMLMSWGEEFSPSRDDIATVIRQDRATIICDYCYALSTRLFMIAAASKDFDLHRIHPTENRID